MNLIRSIKRLISDSNPKLRKLESALHYSFNNSYYLEKAITHRSVQLLSQGNYERLEFLGDAVIDQVVSHYLFKKYPQSDEGTLTKKRASLVNRNFLSMLGQGLGIMAVLRIDSGVNLEDEKVATNISADVYEALVGAVYLDGGIKPATELIKRTLCLSEHLADENTNFKGQLIEFCHQKNIAPPLFLIVNATGPEHEKTFTVMVNIDGKNEWKGTGTSKKAAEQEAAQLAIESLKYSG